MLSSTTTSPHNNNNNITIIIINNNNNKRQKWKSRERNNCEFNATQGSFYFYFYFLGGLGTWETCPRNLGGPFSLVLGERERERERERESWCCFCLGVSNDRYFYNRKKTLFLLGVGGSWFGWFHKISQITEEDKGSWGQAKRSHCCCCCCFPDPSSFLLLQCQVSLSLSLSLSLTVPIGDSSNTMHQINK